MYTRVSVAMGYELGVTPVQLAAAYGAIANDGLLLTPTLVREIRSPEGELLYRHQPEPVRQVVTSTVAARLREFLRGAVGEGGTGEEGQLANYSLLGKTGTAVRFEGGRYVRGEYTASFAALFPADDPQLVIVVKIDNPRGRYYGGLTAAPVTRMMLQQALASRRVAIDRSRLAPAESVSPRTQGPAAAPVGVAPVVLTLPYAPPAPAAISTAVPNVRGRTARGAALELHRQGFRVVLRGLGRVTRTQPGPGEQARRGSAVTVWTAEGE
jgi:cell division protein FtsI (penicillin-binding protein 3)